MSQPTLRKPFGIFAILLYITFWSVVTIMGIEALGDLHIAIQLVLFLLAGMIWIAPLRPLLRWMETGRFR